MLLLSQYITTHADDSRRSNAVCVRVIVSPQHNSKTNDPKVFKLGSGMTFGYPRSGMVLYIKRSKVKVTGSQSAKTY